MSWLVRWFIRPTASRTAEQATSQSFQPQPPPGFVRRSDPNFYFLARKF
jgi:hypothetical protein